MKGYGHVFFDLDHTLWDFKTNSRETLRELHRDLGLQDRGIQDPMELIEEFEEINAQLWQRYESGGIDKAVLRVLRFRQALGRFGVRDDKLARQLGAEYLERCPKRTALHAGVRNALDALQGRVAMHVITNGFSEVQHVKLRCSGIEHHFSVVLTSEDAGARKPSPGIFLEAMRRAGTDAHSSLMVGDDPRADLAGARAVGMDQAHFHDKDRPADPLATFAFAHFDRLLERLS